MKDEKCGKIVDKEWISTISSPNSMEKVQNILKNYSTSLIRWSCIKKTDAERVNLEKTEVLKSLQDDEGPHNVEAIRSLQKQLGLLLEKEDLKWRQWAK